MAKQRVLKIKDGMTDDQVADAIEEMDEVTVGEELTADEVKILVDRAYRIDQQQKDLTRQLKPIKLAVQEYGRRHKLAQIEGHHAVASLSPSTETTTGTATELAALLKREGKITLFDDVVKVKLGELKKYLGEDALKGYIQKTTKKFAKLAFKARR